MTPKRYLAKADRALESARLLLTDGDIEGACNRAYYAMYDAAQAALLLSGAAADPAEIRTHSGLIGAFGKHLVKTGRIPADLINHAQSVHQYAPRRCAQVLRGYNHPPGKRQSAHSHDAPRFAAARR